MMEQQKKFISTAELVERWGNSVSAGTIANWRSEDKRRDVKRSPPYQKFGHKVMYPVASLEKWEMKNEVNKVANDNNESEK